MANVPNAIVKLPKFTTAWVRCTSVTHRQTDGRQQLANVNVPQHAVNWGRFCFWRRQSVCFFVCVWNISGISERICAKFTRKNYLVPRSDHFTWHVLPAYVLGCYRLFTNIDDVGFSRDHVDDIRQYVGYSQSLQITSLPKFGWSVCDG